MSTPTPAPAPHDPSDRPGPDTATTAAPPSNAGWAVASALFFWPLAFAAFTHAFNVYPLWARGDIDGARDASERARRLGQISLWLAGALLLLFAIIWIVVAVVLITHGGDGGDYDGRGGRILHETPR
jgi:hypothetical protein